MKPYYQHKGITIYHGDSREIVPGLDKVDLVLTDPPYLKHVIFKFMKFNKTSFGRKNKN